MRWPLLPRLDLPNEHGYAMAFWAVFLATVLVPLLVLVWDVGLLFYARGEVQKAADAAALAAVQEVSVPHYRSTRELMLNTDALAYASKYALRNSRYLLDAGITPHVTRITVNNENKTVYVQMQADVSALFPEFITVKPISVWGEAQVQTAER
jgi:uncharacterized membrane protein